MWEQIIADAELALRRRLTPQEAEQLWQRIRFGAGA